MPQASTYINFLSVSLIAAASHTADVPNLSVQSVRSTTKWMQPSSSSGNSSQGQIQQIEILLNNLSPLNGSLSQWITTPQVVTLSSTSLDTVIPATFQRLRSNDQLLLKVGVVNKPGVQVGSKASADVIIRDARQATANVVLTGGTGWSVTAGIPGWESNDESLATHEAPDWVCEYSVKFYC